MIREPTQCFVRLVTVKNNFRIPKFFSFSKNSIFNDKYKYLSHTMFSMQHGQHFLKFSLHSLMLEILSVLRIFMLLCLIHVDKLYNQDTYLILQESALTTKLLLLTESKMVIGFIQIR